MMETWFCIGKLMKQHFPDFYKHLSNLFPLKTADYPIHYGPQPGSHVGQCFRLSTAPWELPDLTFAHKKTTVLYHGPKTLYY